MKLTKVFYDGKCGLCSKEINYYKRIAPKNIFEWHDIATNPKILREINVSQYDALMYLHAIDQKSNLKIGVDAFILIWAQRHLMDHQFGMLLHLLCIHHHILQIFFSLVFPYQSHKHRDY